MNQKPNLILFCGLPGSGKTTLAKWLENKGEGIRICTDEWQNDLEMNNNDNNFHLKLQGRLYEFALDLIKHGQDVILEDGLWKQSERIEKLTDGKKHGAKVKLYLFNLTFEEIWERLDARNNKDKSGLARITKVELEKYWNKFEKPTNEELETFDEFEIIDNENKTFFY